MVKVDETTELVFTTESGSTYEIANGKIRRLGETSLRRDEEWVAFAAFPELYFDTPAILWLEHLSGDPEGVTLRQTTPVTGIEIKEIDNEF